MIRIEDFGEITYGGAVTLAEWWDNKRITEGKIGTKDVFKKASFYTYLGVGLTATVMSVFGFMRRWGTWQEHVSHGFFYDLPRFTYNLSKSLGSEGRSRSGSAAIQEAQRIINQKALAAGRVTDRSYQPEFATVGPYAM